jgi:hypothetical protein
MRNLLFLICVLGTSSILWSQSPQVSWQNLKSLHAGEKIQVLEVNSTKITAAFVSVSYAAISVQGKAGEKTIDRQDVRSIKLMKNKRRLRNTLIGAGVGAGAGAGITAAAWEPHGFLGGRGTGAAVGAVIFGVAGAIVGALVPSHEAIYDAGAH